VLHPCRLLNIRLGWKCLQGTNDLGYFASLSLTEKKKSFITLFAEGDEVRRPPIFFSLILLKISFKKNIDTSSIDDLSLSEPFSVASVSRTELAPFQKLMNGPDKLERLYLTRV
jgi:hypothetical protein